MKLFFTALSNLLDWRYCQRCMDRTRQKYVGPHWFCEDGKHKVDRNGRLMK